MHLLIRDNMVFNNRTASVYISAQNSLKPFRSYRLIECTQSDARMDSWGSLLRKLQLSDYLLSHSFILCLQAVGWTERLAHQSWASWKHRMKNLKLNLKWKLFNLFLFADARKSRNWDSPVWMEMLTKNKICPGFMDNVYTLVFWPGKLNSKYFFYSLAKSSIIIEQYFIKIATFAVVNKKALPIFHSMENFCVLW